MAHGHIGAALQMTDASYIRRHDAIGLGRLDMGELAIAQGFGQFGLRNRAGAGRAAAQMRFGERLKIESKIGTMALADPAQSIPVLPRAGGVEGQETGTKAGRERVWRKGGSS